MTRKEAKQFIESLKAIREGADDNLASLAPCVYPSLAYNGKLVKAGTRILFDGVIYKAPVDLWDTKENNPVNSPNLWAELGYKNGIRIIPTTITVTTAFSENELGLWTDGNVYKSLVNNNVYTPEQYAPNWELHSKI